MHKSEKNSYVSVLRRIHGHFSSGQVHSEQSPTRDATWDNIPPAEKGKHENGKLLLSCSRIGRKDVSITL